MMAMKRRLQAGGVVLALLAADMCHTTRARAEEGAVAIALHYRAGARCPDEEAFLGELRARSARIRRAATSETAYTATVTLVASVDSSVGDVVLRDVDGRLARRHLVGGDCSEVARVLALVIALDAVGAAVIPPPPIPQLTNTAPPPPPVPASWPVPRASVPTKPVEPITARLARPPDSPAARWSPIAVAQGGARTGVAPSVAPSASLMLGAERDAGANAVDTALLLGVLYASTDAAGSGDTVAFRLVSATLDLCVWHPPLGPRVTLMPCAHVEGSYHFADVVPGTQGAAGAGEVALGLAAWLRVRITGRLFASAMVAGEVPLTPATFTEQHAGGSLFVTPPVSVSTNVGVGVSFP